MSNTRRLRLVQGERRVDGSLQVVGAVLVKRVHHLNRELAPRHIEHGAASKVRAELLAVQGRRCDDEPQRLHPAPTETPLMVTECPFGSAECPVSLYICCYKAITR